MKKLKVYLVTGNQHKYQEVLAIARAALGDLFPLLDLQPINLQVEEKPGFEIYTFFLNSYLKAKAGFEHTGTISIGDDSGLVIPSLLGFPGGLSSRLLSSVSQIDRNKALASMMANLPTEGRRAYFHCSATLFLSSSEFVTFSGRIYGVIAPEPRGDKGFGYDPVFIPEGYSQTFAELGPEIKNAISHRAKAFFRLFQYLIPVIRCRSD